MPIVRCVLSGSFRRDFANLERDYRELIRSSCQVLSPHRLDFADPDELFVKDTAETALSVEQIEQHHLVSLRQADFVWLHCPGGHIGTSAALEIGYAAACNKPIFSKIAPEEEVFRSFVCVVPSVFAALEQLGLSL